MARVSLTIDQIRQMQIGTACMVHQNGRIYFSRLIAANERLQVSATTYNSTLEVDDIPEKFQLAAQFYVLARYWSGIDSDKANYYLGMYREQWAKVKQNRIASGRFALGDDI